VVASASHNHTGLYDLLRDRSTLFLGSCIQFRFLCMAECSEIFCFCPYLTSGGGVRQRDNFPVPRSHHRHQQHDTVTEPKVTPVHASRAASSGLLPVRSAGRPRGVLCSCTRLYFNKMTAQSPCHWLCSSEHTKRLCGLFGTEEGVHGNVVG
jgi:hypothetical protein